MKQISHDVTRKKVARRLKIVQGQLKHVLHMVENDSYCIDVINQSRAIQHALRETSYLLLENHLQTCVVDYIKQGKTHPAITEIMSVVKNNDK